MRALRPWIFSLLLFLWSVVAVSAAPTVSVTCSTRNVLAPGQNLDLSVSATGSGTLTYQWLRKGKTIDGATTSTFAITDATYADGDWYLVDATDSTGTTRSKPIFVTVAPLQTQIVRWGRDSLGVPTNESDAVGIFPDSANLYVLRRNGTVVGYGTNRNGETNIPSGLTGVVQVSGPLALKEDGAVSAWGDYATQNAIPAGLNNVVAIASDDSSGFLVSIALKSDGTVAAWGTNIFGQCDVPSNLNGVVAIALGDFQAMALRNDGTIVAWGSPSWGGAPPPPGLSNVTAITGGWLHSLALKSDGTVVSWGSNNTYGQSTVPAGLADVVAMCAGTALSMVLKDDGTVLAWGNSPTVPATLSAAFMIGAKDDSSYALRDASNDTAPAVTVQPQGQTVSETQLVTLSATITGTAPLTLQWRKNGTNIDGATSATLRFASFTAHDAGDYDLVATNYLGSITTSVATLAVVASPVVTTVSAVRQVLSPSDTLNLSVTATGTGGLTYQWIHNGRIIPGAASASLIIPNSTAGNGGWYMALVTDSIGTRRSKVMFVDVVPAMTQVSGWGNDASAQIDIPAGLNNAIRVAAGYEHALALKRDGTVVGWGKNLRSEATVPVGLSEIVAIVAGTQGSAALKSNGTVISWGDLPAAPVDLMDVVSISTNGAVALALKSNGTVVAWGLDLLNKTQIPADLTDVVAVATGGNHGLALKRNGSVVAWGYNVEGQTSVPFDLANVVSIAAGTNSSWALTDDDKVIVWGETSSDQSNVPATMANAVAIATGISHYAALIGDGTVVGWGGQSYSGQGVPPTNLGGVFSISLGGYFSLALYDPAANTAPIITKVPVSLTVTEGQPAVFRPHLTGAAPFTYQWRKNGVVVPGATLAAFSLAAVLPSDAGSYDAVITNAKGSVSTSAATLTVRPLPVVTALSPTRKVLQPGQNLDLSVTATGTGTLTYQWFQNGRAVLGATNNTFTKNNITLADEGWYVADTTDDFGTRRSKAMFVILSKGTSVVRQWGTDFFNDISVPPGLTDIVSVSAGPAHALALRTNGTVVTWRGDPTNYILNVPDWLDNIVAIAAGGSFSVALKSDGTVVEWGGGYGSPNTVPSGLVDVVSIAADSNHVVALKSNGTVVTWVGAYYSGSLPPPELADVVSIAAGYNHSIALKKDGTVVEWGQHDSGGTDMPSGLNDAVAVSAGGSHSVALKQNGTVVAWGLNTSGQNTVPAGLANVVSISAKTGHSLALKSNGTVVAWGDYATQIQIPTTLDSVTAISAGYSFALTLQSLPIITSQPSGLTCLDKQPASFTVAVYSVGPLTYQWQKNGVNIGGATGPVYSLPSVTFGNAGDYAVVITNSGGSVTSSTATLIVNMAPPTDAIITITVE